MSRASLSLLAAVVSARQFIIVDNPDEVPSKAPVKLIDTDSMSSKTVGTFDGSKVYVAGATVCDGKYYAVYTDIPRYGLAELDIKTGQTSELMTDGLLHTIWCGKESGTLLAIQSNPSPPFSVVSYDIAKQNTTTIATFDANFGSGGNDSIFSYDETNGQVWATMVDVDFSKVKNALNVADLATGKVTSYPYKLGFGRQLFPTAGFPAGPAGEGAQFTGLMSKQNALSGQISFSKHTIKGGNVLTSLGGDAHVDYTTGRPFAVCDDGKAYSIAGDFNLVAFDTTSLKQDPAIDLFALGFNHSAGGVACL